MAGEGRRFKDVGYETPKPLIDVNGLPMVVRALKSMPPADLNVLIVRRDQVDSSELRDTVLKHFGRVEIVEIDRLTEGQASTCLLAERAVPTGSIINIGACDNELTYDPKKYEEAIASFDTLVWTYRGKDNVLENPAMYGWVKTVNQTTEIESVSCKVPISDDPINDHAVSGTFTFTNSDELFEGIRTMISKNDRVNGEFYLDVVPNHLTNRRGVFELSNHECFGTPQELEKYLSQVNGE